MCGVGCGNTGNDASFAIGRALIKERVDADFILATPFPEQASGAFATGDDLPVVAIRQQLGHLQHMPSALHTVWALLRTEVPRVARVYRLIRASDGVVVTGTGIFDDFGERPWNMPYGLLLWIVLARLARRPFVLMSVGAGPIQGRLNRRLFVAAARLATGISYRDEDSRRFMASIGAGRSDERVCPDLVWAQPVPTSRLAAPSSAVLNVAVGVMSYGGWGQLGVGAVYEDYLQLVTSIVEDLLSAGHTVTMLIGQPVDEPVIARLLRALPPDLRAKGTIHIPQIATVADLLAAIAETDIVVATRFHNVLAALLLRRPVISLSYAPKNAQLLQAVGLSGFDRAVEDADLAWVRDRFAELTAQSRGLTDTGRQWLADTPAAVRAEIDTVVATILPRLGTRSSADGRS